MEVGARRGVADFKYNKIYKHKMEEKRLARLVGYLLSDASVKIKKRSNRKGLQIELSIECADLCITEDFAMLCSEFTGREVGKISNRKRSPNWRETYPFACKINKMKSEFLFKLTPTYSKMNLGCKIPNFILKNQENIVNFLQAFTNSEGSIRLRVLKNKKWWQIQRYVKLSSKNPAILNGIQLLLNSLQIRNRKVPRKIPVGIIIQEKQSLKKFNELINFGEGIEVSPVGIWGGYEKRNVLEMVVNSLSMKRGELQKFKTEEEVYGFLKNVNYFPEMDSET